MMCLLLRHHRCQKGYRDQLRNAIPVQLVIFTTSTVGTFE